MKRVLLAVTLSLLAVPALAQSSTTPGSLGGNQVGTGAIEPQRGSGGVNAASASSAITTPPSQGTAASSTTTGSAPAGTSLAATGGSTVSGSPGGSGGGGGHGGGIQALCLSASGSVTSVNPDEFALDCRQ
ncbi:MAG TPA: hypothetical protein VGG57_19635 [Stellaceae bacterium]|jgi:hypothetical protein